MANERSGGDLYHIAKLNPVVGASYGIAHLRTMCVAEDLDAMQKAAHARKIVCLKAWPGFSWQDAEMMKKPHDELHRLASERLVFPLACFLVAAESHCYFCYTWDTPRLTVRSIGIPSLTNRSASRKVKPFAMVGHITTNSNAPPYLSIWRKPRQILAGDEHRK